MGQLRLLLLLYLRPLRAMSEIIDEGSLLFGAVAVLVASLVTGAAMSMHMLRAIVAHAQQAGPPRPHASPAPGFDDESLEGMDEYGAIAALTQGKVSPQAMMMTRLVGATSSLSAVFVLAVLYAPVALFLLTVFEPIGSFGVAFRRDFGPFLACTFIAWAAARLPFAVVALGPVDMIGAIALLTASGVYFTGLMACAMRVVFGARTMPAVGAAVLGWAAMFLEPFLFYLASPFVAYYAYQYVRGDMSDVLWSFGARQSFKRYLAAATVNPRDADAHYQLGLIHLQRRQMAEAEERFRKAAEIDPREVDAHYQLGRLARGKKAFADALRHFEAVVKQDPKHASHEVWREIGATYVESDSWAEAKWALAKFVETRSHDAEGLYRLGVASAKLGEKDVAREMFKRAIEAVDTSPRYIRRQTSAWRKLASDELAKIPA